MKPIDFKGVSVIVAKDQPEYKPLPSLVSDDKERKVVSCWRLSFWERLKVLIFGNIWLSIITHGNPLQPIIMGVKKPFKVMEPLPNGFKVTFKAKGKGWQSILPWGKK